MSALDWEEVKRALDEVLDAPIDARDVALERACGADAALRARVDALLAGEADSRGFLEPGSDPPPLFREPELVAPPPGARVGPYELERVLGVGDHGVVYAARQERPARRVALKLSTAAGVPAERFASEAELLARLDHPGVARLFEVGTLLVGPRELPWFAMELVEDARPFVPWAREGPRPFQEVVDLGARFCDALASGHRRGVIHRDVKPAHLLVDVDGEPKVIDFGIAKLAGAPRRRTESGAILGTLAYMSPEQCADGPSRVDTRSDVYSLGVVLYEALAGRPPLRLGGLSLREVVDAIGRDEPEPLQRLRPELPRDLAAVVHKALAKDPALRYATAEGLADDLRRALGGEPVAARRPTPAYVSALWLRRHRGRVAGALAALALVAGVVVGLSRRAQLARAEERRSTQAVTSFLSSMVTDALPSRSGLANADLGEVLDLAAARLEAGAEMPPIARAELEANLGGAYLELGRHAEAERHARAAVALLDEHAPGRTETACVRDILADVLLARGRYDDAIEVLHEARALHRSIDGTPPFLLAMSESKLAQALLETGEAEAASAFAHRAHAIYVEAFGEVHAATVASTQVLADAHRARGGTAQALVWAEASIRLAAEVHGEESLHAADAYETLADAYLAAGRPHEARVAYARSLAGRERLLPAGHPALARLRAALVAAGGPE